jgi:hypothetical protein
MRVRDRVRAFVVFALGLAVLATLPGCTRSDRVAEARANCAVELLGFSVERPLGAPAVPPPTPGAGEGGAAAATEAGATAPVNSLPGAPESEARLFVADAERSTVRLRVKVKRSGAQFALPGLTVEAVLQDGETGNETEVYRAWLALSASWPGNEQVVEAELPGVPYREGDTFEVTLRAQVPPVERSLYREFAQR